MELALNFRKLIERRTAKVSMKRATSLIFWRVTSSESVDFNGANINAKPRESAIPQLLW
jgi:hypothetical protein